MPMQANGVFLRPILIISFNKNVVKALWKLYDKEVREAHSYKGFAGARSDAIPEEKVFAKGNLLELIVMCVLTRLPTQHHINTVF